jgi:hypothetical protein
MRRVLAVATFVMAVSIALATQALEDPTPSIDADTSCFVATLTMLESPDPAVSAAGQVALMYWLGKIDGADPTLDLEVRIAEIAPTMTREIVARELIRCGGEMMARGREVQEMGARLAARGL